MSKLTLQVLWFKNSLGLAVNQKTSSGLFPITAYYFWPINEAWEQLQIELKSKPWIEEGEQIKLLNLAVEVINQWQQTQNDTTNATAPSNDIKRHSQINVVGSL